MTGVCAQIPRGESAEIIDDYFSAGMSSTLSGYRVPTQEVSRQSTRGSTLSYRDSMGLSHFEYESGHGHASTTKSTQASQNSGDANPDPFNTITRSGSAPVGALYPTQEHETKTKKKEAFYESVWGGYRPACTCSTWLPYWLCLLCGGGGGGGHVCACACVCATHTHTHTERERERERARLCVCVQGARVHAYMRVRVCVCVCVQGARVHAYMRVRVCAVCTGCEGACVYARARVCCAYAVVVQVCRIRLVCAIPLRLWSTDCNYICNYA